MALPRPGVELAIQHLAPTVIEFHDRLPLASVLGASSQLTCLFHYPREAECLCVRVQDTLWPVCENLLSVSRVSDVINTPVAIPKIDGG